MVRVDGQVGVPVPVHLMIAGSTLFFVVSRSALWPSQHHHVQSIRTPRFLPAAPTTPSSRLPEWR